MGKEPLGLYIFRFLLICGIFLLLGLLYWSSTSLEQDVKKVISDQQDLKKEIETLHQSLHSSPTRTANPLRVSSERSIQRPHIDPNLPNILQEDPFFSTTLPKLLGEGFRPHGTFQRDQLGRPDNLHPFTNWSHIAAWNSMCTVSVARSLFGKYESYAPNMAIKVEERKNEKTGEVEFWVHLRKGVFWQPLKQSFFPEGIVLAKQFLEKQPVTAEDFKFYFDAVMNPYVQEAGAIALRTYLSDIAEIKVLDPLTFIVRWKSLEVKEPDGTISYKPKYIAKLWTGALRPLASFVYKYFSDGAKVVEDDSNPETYRTNSVWAQNFNQHWAKNVIVSCGPWIFDGMTDRQIHFKRNPAHFFPYDALAEATEVHFKDTLEAIWEDFKIGKTDTYELRPDELLELSNFLQSPQYQAQVKSGKAIKRLDYVARVYAYIGWNSAKPYFSSKKVRQAMTMAIDRSRIIRQNLNGMGIETNGTFYRYSNAYDTSLKPWPYDVQQAKRLLEDEGWYDSDNDGIIDKQINEKKVPFSFSLTYYVKTPTTKAICEYIATALKDLGINCHLNGVDIADLSAAFEDKSFDGLSLAWSLGTPPEDPKQVWYSAGAREKGSSNAVGFANKEADAIIDALQYETNPEKRVALYHRFDAIIHEEAPYTFLYTPKVALLYREYVKNVFLPVERKDLIPGADVSEPDNSIFSLD